MSDPLEALGAQIAAACPDAVIGSAVTHGELRLEARREMLLPLMRRLRDDPRFAFVQLMDLCGVDWPERPERFDVVYNLLAPVPNRRLRVVVATDEATPVPSVVEIWPAAGWFEREAWDLFGILFEGNPDLRRILTDYGFEGHPCARTSRSRGTWRCATTRSRSASSMSRCA